MDKKEEFRKRLMATFRIEAKEHLAAISSGLIELEKSGSGDKKTIVETVFRAAHSLKGASRAVSLAHVEAACHELESLFAEWKRQGPPASKEVFDSALIASDLLAALLDQSTGPSTQESEQQHIQSLEKIRSLIQGESSPSIPLQEPAAKPLQTPPTHTSVPSFLTKPQAAHESPGAAPALKQPAVAETPKKFVSPVPPRKLVSVAEAPVNHPPLPAGNETIRVSTEKLDSLLLRAEELLSIKQNSEHISLILRDIDEHIKQVRKSWLQAKPQNHLARLIDDGHKNDSDWNSLNEALNLLERNQLKLETEMSRLRQHALHGQRSAGTQIDALLDELKKVSMQPFSTILDSMPRLVRDLARDLGKEAVLTLRCSNVEMDRRILEEMKDPLTHLLRNSLEHGMEKPGVRLQTGKASTGTVVISVEQHSGQKVEIAVSDDGAGLDIPRIKSTAVQHGLISEAEAVSMSDESARQLIFQSGFSTSPIVTDLSGRGLGLAIVRERVEKLGGTLSVESDPGKGTTFRMLLPATRATFRGITVRVQEERFIFPTLLVERVVRVKHEDIRMVENREALRLENRLVSLARLQDVLGLQGPESRNQNITLHPAVLVTSGSQSIAFLVDEVINEHEVLIKSLGSQLRKVRHFDGASMLQGGKLIPVLNVVDLVRSAISTRAGSISIAAQADAAGPAAPGKRILVVEDSITSRALLRNILEAANYTVETAVDGVDGFTRLKDGQFDLVVSDVEMPRLHGFDLTARIRADKHLAEMPVVLVTARESREDREKGIDVGANAYIVKSSFDQSNLLEVIAHLI